MGTFFNPGNGSFTQDKNSEIYIDKTELLKFLNKKLGTNGKCIAVSHARRFGKSHAAGMIDAYYSLGSDSSKLFENTKIASDPDYEKYRNKYNVIHLDISSVWDYHKEDLIESIEERVCEDFQKIYGDLLNYKRDFYLLIQDIYSLTGIPFVIIIDEWDCVIRNSHDQALVHKYLQFLHSLFKSEESKSFLALGYITGILPIKKIKDESALNNFQEYTMLDSYPITEYYGFTEKEVKDLCKDYSMDFETVKAWYNGYLIDGEHMYNPNSVSQALERHKIDSYWRNTSAFDTINTFITMNYAGLKDDVMKMLTGGKVRINTNTFQNDFSIITSKDDALTALIHLGYLGYDQTEKIAFVPNEEIRQELTNAVKSKSWNEMLMFQQESETLLDATLDMDNETVAAQIEKIHNEYASVIRYHDENSLSSVLAIAYLGTMQYYFKPVREFPTGRGFADFIFIPKPEYKSAYPALVVELKWNQKVQTAIQQIKDRKYPSSISDYTGDILLVGINYDKKSKKHQCIIEKV